MEHYYVKQFKECVETSPQVCEWEVDDLVLEQHVQCAAQELPIVLENDVGYFGDSLEYVCLDALIHDSGYGVYVCHPKCKANR